MDIICEDGKKPIDNDYPCVILTAIIYKSAEVSREIS